MIYFIMGVSGSGKTTIGEKLATQSGLPFFDGDDFHPPANISKMASGQALNDEDRQKWLEKIAELAQAYDRKAGAVIACSALKESYRRQLSQALSGKYYWIFLNGSPELILKRMQGRQDHFMPPRLLASQYETLEVPADAIKFDIANSPEEIIKDILILTAG